MEMPFIGEEKQCYAYRTVMSLTVTGAFIPRTLIVSIRTGW